MSEHVIEVEAVEEVAADNHPALREQPLPPALDTLPRIRFQVDEMVESMKELDRFKEEVMRKGTDYDEIPGTNKPTLLKPGAERLMHAFNFSSSVALVRCIEEWDRGFFYYVYRAEVGPLMPDGRIAPRASCEGSCNSHEVKYRYRNVPEFAATEEQKEMAVKRVEKTGKGNRKYWMLTVENDQPQDLVNTLQKMAQKRALVGAVLLATATSEFFTQDVEDMGQFARPEQQQQDDRGAERNEGGRPAAVVTPAIPEDPGDFIIDFGKYKEGYTDSKGKPGPGPTPLKKAGRHYAKALLDKIVGEEEAAGGLSARDLFRKQLFIRFLECYPLDEDKPAGIKTPMTGDDGVPSN